MCGVKTNIVTSCVITDKNAGDSPQLDGPLSFRHLLRQVQFIVNQRFHAHARHARIP